MRKREYFILLLLILFSYPAKAERSEMITWERTYGGSGNDNASSIQQTDDGGYIVAGNIYVYSKGGGDADIWVLKLDGEGNVVWDRTYGGSDKDGASSIQQTKDGGYIVAGYTGSKGAGRFDIYVLKLDREGNVVWDRTYGGSDLDLAWSIQQTKDGGYIVAGETSSKGKGYVDLWVLKLDREGNVIWDRTYGGSDVDVANSIQQTKDGGYIVAGGQNQKAQGSLISGC